MRREMEENCPKGRKWVEGMIGIIIQARLGSTRLPRKVLLPIAGKPIIAHIVDRCLETGFPVVLAVPDGEEPEYVACLLRQKENPNFHIFGGHPTDVLDRYYEVAKAFNFDPIVRITGDCPLVDPNMIKAMVKYFDENAEGCYCSNCHPIRTVPKGMDIEVFSFAELERAWNKTNDYQKAPSLATSKIYYCLREHVTKFFYHYHPEDCLTYSPPFPDSWSTSIDTQEDYERVKAMVEEGKYPWQN